MRERRTDCGSARTTASRASSPGVTRDTAERETILVVDDDPTLLAAVTEFLDREGYTALTAATGEAAMAALGRTKVSLVLLDLELPDMDGVDLLRKAQRLEEPPEVVVVTGHATLDSAIAAVEAGAAGYLVKPVELPGLSSMIKRFLERRALTRENAQLYEEAQTQRTRLTQILDSTSDGIMFVSPDGRIESANRRAAELLGFGSAIVSLRLLDVLPAHSTARDGSPAEAAFRAVLTDPAGGSGDLEIPQHGRVLHWAARPTKDAGGVTVGLTLTFQDVTEERHVSQLKSDFVSFVTHQLRTPLAGIKWMLELAAQGTGVPDEIAEYIQDARGSSERLIGLVNDLLDIARLESGKLAIQLQETSLDAVTRSVLDDLRALVHEKGHRLSVTGGEALPPILVDPQLTRQVILNLTSNGLKYTPPGGNIAIRMSLDGDSVLWAIQDNGIGIPKEAQRQLFQKFFRAENVFAIETEGTGLGLYLVRLIVERFGGQVWCTSEEGKGTTFFVRLPRPRDIRT